MLQCGPRQPNLRVTVLPVRASKVSKLAEVVALAQISETKIYGGSSDEKIVFDGRINGRVHAVGGSGQCPEGELRRLLEPGQIQEPGSVAAHTGRGQSYVDGHPRRQDHFYR